MISPHSPHSQDLTNRFAGPAAVFCLIMVCFNLLGDGLHDALDPRMRN